MTLRPIACLLALALLPACERRLVDDDEDDTGTVPQGDRPHVGGDLSPADTGSQDTGGQDSAEPTATEACYLGATRGGDECLPLVDPTNPGDAYDYPAPLQGSANYRPPVAYLDLSALDPSTKLAPNFVLGEFAQEAKGRYAVVQPHLIDSVQALRDDLGPIVVNSGYRSPAYNSGVDGSATYSRHMYGDAADLDPVDVSLDTLKQACLAEGAGYVGVYVAHIHCDWRDQPVDEAFFGPAGRSRLVIASLPEQEAWIARDGDRLAAPAEGWDEGEPLREWSAYGADGALLGAAIADTFAPPPGTDEVVVVVGRALTRRIRLAEL